MVKITYSDEFICPKCGRHTALVCRIDGTHQAHCMICDVYYDVEIAKTTNADRIRSMSVEEMAEFFNGVEAEAIRRAGLFITIGDIQRGKDGWLDWLKQEVSTNG